MTDWKPGDRAHAKDRDEFNYDPATAPIVTGADGYPRVFEIQDITGGVAYCHCIGSAQDRTPIDLNALVPIDQ